ncbi:hypothetical protein ACFLY2_00700 [Patescibacteria group bacterium]
MKNHNKLITIIFTVIFITVFSYFNFSEYKEFHQNKINLEKQQSELNEKINSFELGKIKELKNIQFYYTPDKKLLTHIVSKIGEAKKEIFLETYMLTEKRIQEALVKAQKR